MPLTFGWESLKVLLNEPNVSDLLRSHWEELAVHKDGMPLDPDFDRMLFYEEKGLFRVWAARDGKTLAGYLAWIVQPHLHYKSTLTALEDLFLLAPRYRRGANGIRLFTTSFEALRELQVKRVMVHEKVHFQRERVEAKMRDRLAAIVARAVAGDETAVDDLVEMFFEGQRTGLGLLFKRLGFIHTDNLWSMAL